MGKKNKLEKKNHFKTKCLKEKNNLKIQKININQSVGRKWFLDL